MQFFRTGSYTRSILMLVGGLFLVAAVCLGIRGFMRWDESQYFGKILRMTDSGFAISDVKTKERIVDITDQTVVKKGIHREQGSLRVGDQVMVIGGTAFDGHVKASLVRVVEVKKNSSPSNGTR